MVNVIIPIGTKSVFFEGPEYPYPSPLIEVGGKPMIERVIQNLKAIADDVKIIFVLRKDDCQKFHLDKTMRLLAGPKCEIVQLEKETKGAVCSTLLAVDHIDKDKPLIISNADQTFDVDLKTYFTKLMSEADAGCLYFQSVLPRWSYVKLDQNSNVLEAAEKNPISKNAIAGFYFFKQGETYVQAAMRTIYNEAHYNNQYFVAPVFNELILDNKKVKAYAVPNESYHSFYSPQKIAEYENRAR